MCWEQAAVYTLRQGYYAALVDNLVIATSGLSREILYHLGDSPSFTKVPLHLDSVDPHVLRETPSIA